MFTSQRWRGISFLVGEMPIEVLNDDLLEKYKKQYMNKFLDFDKENKFLCQYCPDDFEIYDAFKNHIMEVHEKSWIFDKEEKNTTVSGRNRTYGKKFHHGQKSY